VLIHRVSHKKLKLDSLFDIVSIRRSKDIRLQLPEDFTGLDKFSSTDQAQSCKKINFLLVNSSLLEEESNVHQWD
jgi:hypothetical protein